MRICLVICFLLVSSVSGLSRHKRHGTGVTRSAKYNVIVSHMRLGDCSYVLTFLRGDNTPPLPDLTIHYAVDDSVFITSVDTGSTLIVSSDQSVELNWSPPDGFVNPYDVTGVTQISDDEGGTVEQHTIDDGDCNPATTRGDPHMRTFDGHGYSFQGLCWYTLAKHCTQNPDFEIMAEFAPRASTGPEIRTRAVSMNVTVGDEHISMDSTNTVLINGRPLWAAKLSGEPRNVEITSDSSRVNIKIPRYNMDVLWDGRKHAFSAAISHPDYHGNICGLLGNGDGDPKNDFQKRDGSQTNVIDEFGESWKVADTICEY